MLIRNIGKGAKPYRACMHPNLRWRNSNKCHLPEPQKFVNNNREYVCTEVEKSCPLPLRGTVSCTFRLKYIPSSLFQSRSVIFPPLAVPSTDTSYYFIQQGISCQDVHSPHYISSTNTIHLAVSNIINPNPSSTALFHNSSHSQSFLPFSNRYKVANNLSSFFWPAIDIVGISQI